MVSVQELCQKAGVKYTPNKEALLISVKNNIRLWTSRANAPDLLRRQEAERRIAALDALLSNVNSISEDNLGEPLNGTQNKGADANENPKAKQLKTAAWECYDKGDYEGALRYAQQVSDLVKLDPMSWVLRSHIYEKLNKIGEAYEEMLVVISLSDEKPSYYFRTGTLANRLRDKQNAIKYIRMAVNGDPNKINYQHYLEELERGI